MPLGISIHSPKPLPFDKASTQLFGSEQTSDTISLVVIDPEDIGSARWALLKNILTNGKVDLILTVMTYALARNHSIALKNPEGKIAETVTDFFGDIHWKELNDSEELMNYYLSKIQSLGYKVFTIKVHRIGQSKLYDIILATKNQRVSKIFGDLTDKMDQVNPSLLKAAIGSNQKESIELDSYFEMK